MRQKVFSIVALLLMAVTGAVAQSYNVTVKNGTEDADKWSATPNPATAGQTVTVKYNGTKKVKSVKAKKKAVPTASTLAESTLGMIVGTDGKVYAVADKNNLPSGVTAVAMVAYKSATTGKSLAIALADEGSMNWNSARSTCGGKTAIGGKSWKLPTMDEWKQMFSANGGNEDNYSGLNTAITNAGGTALNDVYWSSSEGGEYDWEEEFYEEAWDVDLYYVATWLTHGKYESRRVRAVLAF